MLKTIKSLVFTGTAVGFMAFLNSCNYAKSNHQVVISSDCGMTWKKINAGDAVPKGSGKSMLYESGHTQFSHAGRQ